ncbi:MAG: PorV/PorQ family protein [Saprospiraceae bacterium]|nr:PorV/PorQ family protein [Saprospiraceae bacterium]
MQKIIFTFFSILAIPVLIFAGNPDRQGEAGAYELLMNPWARSGALNSLNASCISGVEAMMVNVAGISRINKWEIGLSQTKWLRPSGININAGGFAVKIGKSGTLGVSLMNLDFGEIRVTTNATPEGTGATYSPSFSNIGVGYAHTFGNKIAVGVLFKGISESIQDLNTFGFSIDAGVQYVSGAQDNFKFGIALRNVGGPMSFSGDGLSTQLKSPENTDITYNVRLSQFELPSQLHIGISYDFIPSESIKLTPMLNFTSNSFGRDEIGAGAEIRITQYFALRGSYKYELGSNEDKINKTAHTGLAAGASVSVPLKKKSETRLAIDYGYKHSDPFQGTHQFGVRLEF